nr:glycerol-3-phosphate dehydrogenase/oxidase [Caldalkalibacillus salinus]
MSHFSSMNRRALIEGMEQTTYDVLVIGGGITGAGVALDATTRGMKTALVEMQDFAAGTSSRSTKLVHGGLRYLKQLEVKMVASVGKERAIVYENGPHVTTPEWMLLPVYKGGTFGKFSTSIGLMVYDYLANVKKQERRQMLKAEATLDKEPLLKEEGLKGSGVYVEYRTDDARLTIEVLKEAVAQGASAVNYAQVESLIYRDGQVVGVRVLDHVSGKTSDIYAKKVVNATGPWVDTLREKDQSKRGKTLQLTKGVHIVIDQKYFPLQQAIYFDTPDGRMIFAIPRDGKTYVGTTDTVFQEDLAYPKMTKDDLDYLLDAIDDMFPTLKVTAEHVESSWAGVRPLIHEEGKGPSEISRKDEIWQSDTGLITIAGGKLTGYRKMAESIVNMLAQQLEKEEHDRFKPCQTKDMPISGGHVGGSEHFPPFVQEKTALGMSLGLNEETAKRLVHTYGSNVDRLYHRFKVLKEEAKQTALPPEMFLALVYSIEEEMVVTPADFFVRRTGSLFFNVHEVQQWKGEVIAYMAKRLGWNKNVQQTMTNELEQHIKDATHPQITGAQSGSQSAIS